VAFGKVKTAEKAAGASRVHEFLAGRARLEKVKHFFRGPLPALR
jgi:hypothetical protein